MNKIKVLVVDDSAIVRQMISRILAEDPEIEVLGTAIDPIFAIQKIMRDPPDVITLDVEMPRMDGLTFLEKLMQSYSIPVVMISALTRKGCETTLRALELGAVDFITKPERSTAANLRDLTQEVTAKVKNAARVNLEVFRKRHPAKEPAKPVAAVGPDIRKPKAASGHKIIAIGASTGGVVAVKNVIAKLVPGDYSVLITLHMPAGFTRSFSERLGAMGGWNSCEAADGQPLSPGCIYVAPGGRNMTVEGMGDSLFIRVRACEKTDIYKPNVNRTFASLAKSAGPVAVGVILTGMGDDGANGLLMMRRAGAVTIAQSQETCMVYGMPKKAIEAGAADYIVPLEQIGYKLMQMV